jgi:hypothetical protein
MAGHLRRAERLYRTSADLVGGTSAGAARAYYRLHELFQSPQAGWGDQSAELQKALAVDPDAASRTLLPAFPEPDDVGELAPYLVPIVLVQEPSDTTAYETLPALSRWKAPADSLAMTEDLGRGTVPIEILVGADGTPLEVDLADAVEGAEAVVATVMEWRFTPAVTERGTAAARIRYGERESDSPQEDSAPKD